MTKGTQIRMRAESIMRGIVEDAKKHRDIESCRDCPALMKSRAGIFCHIQIPENCPIGADHWQDSPYDSHWEVMESILEGDKR